MSRNVYIAATESSSGKSAIALGVMEMMVKKVGHVGFFRPIISAERDGLEKDNDIALIASHFRLDLPYEKAFAFCDVLVIGSGPAGLMAALTAGRSGADVIVAEESNTLGGRLLSDGGTIAGVPAGEWVASPVVK